MLLFLVTCLFNVLYLPLLVRVSTPLCWIRLPSRWVPVSTQVVVLSVLETLPLCPLLQVWTLLGRPC